VSSISIYMAGDADATSSQAFRAVLYENTAMGEPGALRAESIEVEIEGDSEEDWVKFDLSAPVMLDQGLYWLGSHSGSPQSSVYFLEPGGSMRFRNNDYADGAPAIYGSASRGAYDICAFASFEP
jgi:hypothetical protein